MEYGKYSKCFLFFLCLSKTLFILLFVESDDTYSPLFILFVSIFFLFWKQKRRNKRTKVNKRNVKKKEWNYMSMEDISHQNNGNLMETYPIFLFFWSFLRPFISPFLLAKKERVQKRTKIKKDDKRLSKCKKVDIIIPYIQRIYYVRILKNMWELN